MATGGGGALPQRLPRAKTATVIDHVFSHERSTAT